MKKIIHIFLAVFITLGMLAAAPVISARADCTEGTADTWTCTGADTDGMDATTNGSTDTVTVGSGATVDNPNVGDVAIQMVDGTLTNNGGISENADAGAAIVAWGAGDVTNNGGVDANGISGTGVVALDGDVTNNGSVSADGTSGTAIVSDTGDVTNKGSISAGGDAGTGIYTGSGDNVVVNKGSITAGGTDGIAIVTGPGDDKVSLGAGSTTSGDTTAICTCDGNDTVTVGNGATVNGVIDGGADTDTLRFTFLKPSDLTGLSPSGGSLTHNGQFYEWLNFEQLIGLIVKKLTGGVGHGGGGAHNGPRVYFKSDDGVGLGSEDDLGINVFAKPGLIAFIPFNALGSITPGVEGVRFQVANNDDWYVMVTDLGPFKDKPSHQWYQVSIFDGTGTLVSDQQWFDY